MDAGLDTQVLADISVCPSQSSADEIARSGGMREATWIAPHLKILKPNMQVLNVMRMVAVDRCIEIYEDQELALAAFANRLPENVS